MWPGFCTPKQLSPTCWPLEVPRPKRANFAVSMTNSGNREGHVGLSSGLGNFKTHRSPEDILKRGRGFLMRLSFGLSDSSLIICQGRRTGPAQARAPREQPLWHWSHVTPPTPGSQPARQSHKAGPQGQSPSSDRQRAFAKVPWGFSAFRWCLHSPSPSHKLQTTSGLQLLPNVAFPALLFCLNRKSSPLSSKLRKLFFS